MSSDPGSSVCLCSAVLLQYVRITADHSGNGSDDVPQIEAVLHLQDENRVNYTSQLNVARAEGSCEKLTSLSKV